MLLSNLEFYTTLKLLKQTKRLIFTTNPFYMLSSITMYLSKLERTSNTSTNDFLKSNYFLKATNGRIMKYKKTTYAQKSMAFLSCWFTLSS